MLQGEHLASDKLGLPLFYTWPGEAREGGPPVLHLSESPACLAEHSASFLGAGDIPAQGYVHLGREHPCVAPLPSARPPQPQHALGLLPAWSPTATCLLPVGFCSMFPDQRGLPGPPGQAVLRVPRPLFPGFTFLCTSHHHWHYAFSLLMVHFLGSERQEGQECVSCPQQLERCSAHSRCSINTCRMNGWSIFSRWCFHLLMEYSVFSIMSV